MKAPFLLVVLGLFAVSAQADIYKCVDGAGHITFSNLQRGGSGCKRLYLEPAGSSGTPRSSSSASSSSRGAARANPSPAGFPRVEADTQKARDNDRRTILEQELAGEQKALDDARHELSSQEGQGAKNPERVQSARDRVQQHERNIEALRKELSKLK